MGRKTYSFDHDLGAQEAMRRIEPEMKAVAGKYGLKLERGAGDGFRMTRSGVDVVIEVGDDRVSAEVELSWVLEKTMRGQVEKGLSSRIPGLLKP